MLKLKAAELRTTVPTKKDLKKIKKNPIYIVLDNVMDTYNIGGIFRLADAVSAEKVILCGETETPPHTRIKKASINTTEWVSWSYAPTIVEALQELKTQNSKLKIIAVEQNEKSISYDKVDYQFPVALVVGHETKGVSKEVLQSGIIDQIVEIPMWGVNVSLNVIVSLGIVAFKAMENIKKS
ncbi:MAG: TrmH family RNA methyltransferase [bacterium]|nr:TrmH family RNA methyltransferase [bacterium]